MRALRFAIIGTGFWSRFQIAGWREVGGVQCVALYNRTRAKAETLAAEFGVPAVYDDVERMLRNEQLDFLEVITDVDTQPLRAAGRRARAAGYLPEADGAGAG